AARSPLLASARGDVRGGEKGSELSMAQPRRVTVHAIVAARLDVHADLEIAAQPLDGQQYWHLAPSRAAPGRPGEAATGPPQNRSAAAPATRQSAPAGAARSGASTASRNAAS